MKEWVSLRALEGPTFRCCGDGFPSRMWMRGGTNHSISTASSANMVRVSAALKRLVFTLSSPRADPSGGFNGIDGRTIPSTQPNLKRSQTLQASIFPSESCR